MAGSHPIETDGLTKRYGDIVAVEDLDLEVPEGEILGFLGPNGAGKSTTIKILTGLVHPTSGSARVNGWDVATDELQARADLGYLPEVVGLYEDMTGRQYLHYTGRFYERTSSEVVRRTEQLLDAVGLRDAGGRRIGGYSKGMRQRLGLAGALFHDPSVLVLDEPLTGLDPEGVLGMRRAIRRLGQDKTIFLCSHELHSVEALCDRAVIVDDGRVRADGPVDELTAPEDVRLRVTLRPGTEAGKRAADVTGVRSVEEAGGDELLLVLEEGVAVEDAVANLVEADLPVREVRGARPTLEEVFADVTGVVGR
jgi:ABC-2 type transport system ATP-binding protein